MGHALTRVNSLWKPCVARAVSIGMAIVLTLLVGVSRVYLGVHYPTDVIGGWIFGFLWASLCWLVSQRFETQTGVRKERGKTAK